MRFLGELELRGFLSFGPDTPALALRSLNVLVGPNGSGKSNLIEAIHLLRSAPGDLLSPILRGGGVGEWIFKGDGSSEGRSSGRAELGATVVSAGPSQPELHYQLGFSEVGQSFRLMEESLALGKPWEGLPFPHLIYGFEDSRPELTVRGEVRDRVEEGLEPGRSILSQRRDPKHHPEITRLARDLARIRIYRNTPPGGWASARLPQKMDLPNDFLSEDGRNLGLMLNRLRRMPEVKARLLEELRNLYPVIRDVDVQIEGGTVQVFIQEGRNIIPAVRLSDGTLRYLCLLVVLLHPDPPPLICIEEPELGLHPDILPEIGLLLAEASEKTQLIVTTHSDILVDAMTPWPESVVIFDKEAGSTTMRRLDAGALASWLENYRLGELWTRGDLGGTRW